MKEIMKRYLLARKGKMCSDLQLSPFNFLQERKFGGKQGVDFLTA